jgi:hypothetical protein
VLGDPERLVYVNSFAIYGQDSWQLSKRLNVNVGLRYDYEGPVHTGMPNLSVFDPSVTTGLAVAGQDVANVYQRYWGGFSPRMGFALQLDSSGKTVLRGGYGLYEDSIFMKSILNNTGVQNISVFGPEYNPAGTQQVAQAAELAPVIQAGQDVFQKDLASALASQGQVKISTFDKNFRPSYTQSIDLNIQHSFTSSMLLQVGYVGTLGTHLLGLQDINPGALNSLNVAVPYTSKTCPYWYSGATPSTPGNDLQCSRPYFSQFPTFSVIDELRTNLGSNYNSLQSSLRLQNWHDFSAQLGYTWSHALDYETGEIPYVAQDPTNEKGEYGNSDFDVRQTLTGYLDYQFAHLRGPKLLSQGWEINSGLLFHGGTPYTVTSNNNPSGNGEGADRAVKLGNPNAGVSHAIVGGAVQWFQPYTLGCTNCFADAAPDTYSPTRRNQNFNPGYEDVDLAIVKNTAFWEQYKAQLRVDFFNAFNHTNLAPVGFDFASEKGVIGSTLGPYLGNPGIGPGEPFATQFSLKIIF